MRRFPAVLLLLMLAVSPALAELQQSPFLDAAFECVEEGNIFLERYKALTGSETNARLTYGVPYFFGGQDDRSPFVHEPGYTTRKAWQSSDYYRKNKVYFSGFDCVGFANYVYNKAAKKIGTDLQDLLKSGYHAHHVYCMADNPMPQDWAELAKSLQPGDLWVLKHPGLHIMMYVGTLRDFGFTAEELPSLSAYLDYPLVIHCGGHPDYNARMKAYSAASKKGYERSALPPDGGVAVSILGVPLEEAETTAECQDNTLYWFNICGTNMTTFNTANISDYCWYRQ